MQDGESMPRVGPAPVIIVAVGLVAMGLYVALLSVLMNSTTYDLWGAALFVPFLVAISVPILAREALNQGDRALFWILLFALLLKFSVTLVRFGSAFLLYGGIRDAGLYHRAGIEVANALRHGSLNTGLPSHTGSHFLELATGILYSVTRPTLLGGFFVFSWIAFWGLFLLYRAFTIAVPEGRIRQYSRLVFFFPSLLYWPSSTGKESWMLLALGIAALGAARLLSGSTWSGLAVAGLGIWFAAIVRPHVAAMVVIGLVGAYVFSPARRELRQLAPIIKSAALVILAVGAVMVWINTQRFLAERQINVRGGVATALEQASERTGVGASDAGGSQFTPAIARSPTQAPLAIATVLFRPFIFEAHNPQALAAAIEATLLLLFSLAKLPWIFAAIRSMRRQPYVLFAVLYTGLFVFAFSSFSNFGLLARERVQLLPIYFILLSIAPRRKTEPEPSRVWYRGSVVAE